MRKGATTTARRATTIVTGPGQRASCHVGPQVRKKEAAAPTLPTALRRERQALHRCDAVIPDIGPDLTATMMAWPANDRTRQGSSDEATWPFGPCALLLTLGTVRIIPISDERALSELEGQLEHRPSGHIVATPDLTRG